MLPLISRKVGRGSKLRELAACVGVTVRGGRYREKASAKSSKRYPLPVLWPMRMVLGDGMPNGPSSLDSWCGLIGLPLVHVAQGRCSLAWRAWRRSLVKMPEVRFGAVME